MNSEGRYPRVLVVLMTKVKADDPGNLLIRAQFGDWPKEQLAQIHGSAEILGRGDFCGRYYRLSGQDRRFGNLFQRLRGGVADIVSDDAIQTHAGPRSPRRGQALLKTAMKRFGDWLINSGLWELIFPIRLSNSMANFVKDFQPELVYCQGYSLGFTSLPLAIARRFNVPLCFQTTDDWPNNLYPRSPVRWLLRRRARQLIRHATIRLAFGTKMREEYERRYGVPFEVTYHLDSQSRFPQLIETADQVRRIIYTGSLGHRRYEAIQDVLAAVRRMPELARRFQICVYSTGIPKDVPGSLRLAPELKFAPLPTHEQLPAVLATASVLLLPESFNENPSAIEYSLSSKSHIYMMSGRPILVYGPTFSGTIDYAIREGWGLVVSERSESKLQDALKEVLTESTRSLQLRQNAESCARRHHDLAEGRKRFLSIIHKALQDSPSSRPETGT